MSSTPAPVQATDAMQALHELALRSGARYEELLTVPARFALRALDAHSVSLSRWERDRGLLRTLVNVGFLSDLEEELPDDEVYPIAADAAITNVLSGDPHWYSTADPDLGPHARSLLEFSDQRSALSLPLFVGDRLWGELWVGRRDEGFTPDSVPAAVAVAADVATMVGVAERLQLMARMAYEDALTGLGNRRVLDDTLSLLLREGAPGSTVVLCDIDNLKDVNDEHGHAAGDRVIIATADALAAASNQVPGSVAVRLGGDEFVILLVGQQRSTAIGVVETAALTLAACDRPVEISCGIAVVPPGLDVREALDAADAAQYAAKSRGALLVVASDLSERAERRSTRRRFADRRHPAQALSQRVTELVLDLARALPDAPETVGGRLRWLGERLLEPLHLHAWTLSRASLTGDRVLSTDSMGLQYADLTTQPNDLQVDAHFPLEEYPLTAAAISQQGWFAVQVDNDSDDPEEREVLQHMCMQYVVALGCTDGDTGWLLELFGRDDDPDLDVVGALLTLGASALLHRPFVRLTSG